MQLHAMNTRTPPSEAQPRGRLWTSTRLTVIPGRQRPRWVRAHLERAILCAILIGVSLGCAGKERACGLDGQCPPNTVCIDQLCKNVPWWSDVNALTDGTNGADACTAESPPTPVATAMMPRATPAGGWLAGRLLVHGGDDVAGGRCGEMGKSTAQGGSWAPCDGWRAAGKGNPPSRSGAASAVGLGSAWFVGGWQRDTNAGLWVPRGDLWRFGGTQSTWSVVGTSSIPARHHAAAAVQVQPPSVWVHGGDAGTSAGLGVLMPDIRRYRLDLSTWELPPIQGKPPEARAEHGLVALGQGAQLLLFGGRTQAGLKNDLWLFDTKTYKWTRLDDQPTAPTPRRGASLATTKKFVWLFGGRDDGKQGFRNDLWRMSTSALGQWQRVRAGDLGAGATSGGILKPRTDACLAPAGFTALDLLSPPRRSHGLLTPGVDALWLYAGRGECGALGDVWRLAPSQGTWTLSHEDKRGWSCERAETTCAAWCAK